MEIMGILNITPDSFSDGGKYKGLDDIVERAKQMVADGANYIDVGGESTRPGAELVSEEEELRRVIPVIERLSKELTVPISIDTYKAEVARQAVLAGAKIINDVGGARFDPKMPEVMAETGAYVILMHNRSVNTINTGSLTEYDDIVATVKKELQKSIDLVLEAGVSPDKIILDPGIGFAKTIEGNIELMQRIEELHDLEYPILLGVSRKGTIGHLLGGLDVNNRVEGTVGSTCFAISKGIQMVRVHDVLENARAAKVMDALMRDKPGPGGIAIFNNHDCNEKEVILDLLEMVAKGPDDFQREAVLHGLKHFLKEEAFQQGLLKLVDQMKELI